MIIRQFGARHGRTSLSRSIRVDQYKYATSRSIDDRTFRPSTGDAPPRAAEATPEHRTDALDILSSSPTPPTSQTKSIADAVQSIEDITRSLQLELNTKAAARTGAVSASPGDYYRQQQAQAPEIPFRDVDHYNKWRHYQRQHARTGSTHLNLVKQTQLMLNPPQPEDVTLPMLLAHQCHLGQHTSLWNPSNSSYIYGVRDSIHIFSLDIIYAHLRRAAQVVQAVAHHGGIILFVGTYKRQPPQFTQIVVESARRAKGYHIFDRWVPGTLTNGQQLLGGCGVKAVNAKDEELEAFSEQLSQRNHPFIRPDLVIVLNPMENEVCLHECGIHGIPTIGIIDTDADPTRVTYPIPANDDSFRSIALISGVLSQAAAKGQRTRLRAAEEGRSVYDTTRASRILESTGEIAEMDVQEGASRPEADANP